VAAGQDDVWKLQNSGVDVSLRGICAVSDTCCWASGAKGTVIRTTDGGSSWQSIGPPGADAADFRDVQAWDESTAVIMSAGDIDRLYRTTDGGTSWTIVYEHPDPAAFFDGMSFDQTGKHGWLMGDPINGKVQFLITDDSGATWKPLPEERLPSVADGVAAFAASGTHLLNPNSETVIVGLGGIDKKARTPGQASVLMTTNSGSDWQNVSVPMQAGPSSGIFSITAVDNIAGRLVVVGGDYQKPDQNSNNVAISGDFGRSWRLPQISRPTGFRSVVVSVANDDERPLLITTGPSGTDQSTDGGESWSPLSRTGFHTLSFVSPFTFWVAGSEGRVARWRHDRPEQ
ncbi:MAG TPA: hypothetical protein PLY87_02385, partial [Planctomycetaceae bacterium]|nr:hypothetical protein [Planctomycetaceae bacterium]